MKIFSDIKIHPGLIDTILLRMHHLKFAFSVVGLTSIWIALMTSCANQGVGPSGGLKDSIPPEIVSSFPTPLQLQFSENEIEINFNEFVVADNLSEKLIVSPPLGKKPTIRTKGKSIILKLEEDLIPDRTYSFDFGDGIKDYTEGNKINNLRLLFSTGQQLDTLRISGFIYDAKSLIPVPNALATLYSFESDSLFRNMHPDFIARTNDKGFFLFDNLPAGNFKLYGVKDDDKNLHFSSAAEMIAFTDSMLTPIATFVEKTDTIINGNDTTISHGYNEFFPKDLTLLLFLDDQYSQFLISFKRETNDKCKFVFSEPVTDSLYINLIGNDSLKNWNEIEYSQNLDSVALWITDSSLIKKDTLFFTIQYPFTDSTGEMTVKKDTLKMLHSKPVPTQKQSKVKPFNDENYFQFSSNLSSSTFDLNTPIIFEAPSPVEVPADSIFKLIEMINDSTSAPVVCNFNAVKGTKRKFILEFQLKENTKYKLTLDTASVITFSGIPNAGFITKFSTQKKDYYGSIVLEISGIERNGIIQLIKNSSKEEMVIKELPFITTKKNICFDYLKPDKYMLKFIDDLNGNGKWDTGKLSEKRKPEPVYYFEKELTVKSNWEIKENWPIEVGIVKGKPAVDEQNNKKKTGR